MISCYFICVCFRLGPIQKSFKLAAFASCHQPPQTYMHSQLYLHYLSCQLLHNSRTYSESKLEKFNEWKFGKSNKIIGNYIWQLYRNLA